MSSVNTGAFIPTTNVWDVSEIYSTDIKSPEFKELLVRLYQNLNVMAMGVNNRDAGLYNTSEFVCGQQFFPDPALTSASSVTPTFRNVFRKVVNFGALPDTTGKNVAHGITTTVNTSFTRMYGAATDPAGFSALAIPNSDITLELDGTNVTITTTADLTAYTTTYVVLEYIKS